MLQLRTNLLIVTLIGSVVLLDCSSDDTPSDADVGASGHGSGSGGTGSGILGSAGMGSRVTSTAGKPGELDHRGGAGDGTQGSGGDGLVGVGGIGMGGGIVGHTGGLGTVGVGGGIVVGVGGMGAVGVGGNASVTAGAGNGLMGIAGVAGCVLGIAGAAGTAGAASPPVPVPIGTTIHVVAGAAFEGANGTLGHPFPGVADAVAAIRSNLMNCIAWDGRIIVHKGRYEVLATVELPPSADIEFQAGVTMAMGEKVSFHANRDVKVLGSQSERVVFTWLTQDKPWGSFTLFVPTSQNNEFAWATFEHGGRVTYQGISVRGALSLVGAGGHISNCTFQNNSGDDALSLGSSPTKVDHCSFLNNDSDGIDVGGTSGGKQEISHSVFDGNGNDGLDLGDGCDTWAHDNVMSNNGDNGVEIGEACVPVVAHNIMFGNVMGIAIRDDSDPAVTNCTVYANQFGIVGYNFKAAYGQGKGRVSNTIVWGSTIADIVQEEGATTTFSYSCIQSGTYTDSTNKNGNGNVTPLVGEGLISKAAGCGDPLFVNAAANDFHLMSTAGHYNPATKSWVVDATTSPCIDTGDPLVDPMDEVPPNGGRVDMGAYGGAIEASHSPTK